MIDRDQGVDSARTRKGLDNLPLRKLLSGRFTRQSVGNDGDRHLWRATLWGCRMRDQICVFVALARRRHRRENGNCAAAY
jgi:hypothetical protein